MADPRIAPRLRQMPLFADLRAKELTLLILVMEHIHLRSGDVIFREGDEGDSCYFILSGAVDVELPGASTTQRALATLRENELFGQIALVDDGRRSATCIARGSTELLQLHRGDFDALFQSGSQFAFRFQAVIAQTAVQQLRAANARLNALLMVHAPEDDLALTRTQNLMEGRAPSDD